MTFYLDWGAGDHIGLAARAVSTITRYRPGHGIASRRRRQHQKRPAAPRKAYPDSRRPEHFHFIGAAKVRFENVQDRSPASGRRILAAAPAMDRFFPAEIANPHPSASVAAHANRRPEVIELLQACRWRSAIIAASPDLLYIGAM